MACVGSPILSERAVKVMFRHLRLKLTVLYAGLFCAALIFIGATAYIVLADNTHRVAREQLAATGAMFDQLWGARFEHMRDSALRTVDEPGFRSAAVADDLPALATQLRDLQMRSGLDIAFVVTREGRIVGDDGSEDISVPVGLQAALSSTQMPTRGVLRSGGQLYQAAIAPMPQSQDWLIVGKRLDEVELDTLTALSPLPMIAETRTRGDAGWGGDTADAAAVNAFIDAALGGEANKAGRLDALSGDAIALVRPLPALDGTRAVLMLRYPLSTALSSYRTLFGTLLAIGVVGLMGLIAGTWFLARGITQPLSTLERAAKHLTEGVYDTVVVRTRDELSRLAESFNSMTGAIRERERKITQLAYQDAETRLPNRLALERRLAGAPNAERVYLAAIGVDRFAHVRGAIGYGLAGMLVRTLGSRLARLVPNAPMARLSSDVLGIAFLADNEADARKRADTLVANLEESLSLEGQIVDVNVTIGIAQPRGRGETPSQMIERATVALDQARARKQKVGVFDEAAYGDPARNLSLMGEMRRALAEGHVHLVHQPKYNFRSGRIDSAECLVRWRHPTRGLIPPDLFVPMAEDTGHIRALTEWTLERAVVDQKRLAAAGHTLTLSVNISARLLSDVDFARRAVEIVKQAPQQIGFEITETAVIDNPDVALANIELFARNGVRVAIDDYGAGLSSLAYLKQLPAHELKIDKLFVQNMTNSQRDALLVRSTVDLAHGLGMEVVAEGVETPAAFALLASMRCDLAQGFLVSRPASVDELIAILNDERRMRYYQQTALGAPVAAVPDLKPRAV